MTEAYAETRARWEPLYEAMQIKGDGETHPYKFGMIGETDSHTALATAQEDNSFGKHPGAEPNPDRWKHPMAKVGDLSWNSYDMAASGLAGVWAKENTRRAIFDAQTRQPISVGYTKGVPMGGDLSKAPEGRAPSFLVGVLKDPISGNLDRIQIVKVWLDRKDTRHEKVYDVVWAVDRQPGADGKLPPVGNTVDVANATWTNTIGTPELIGVWSDPDFDATEPASYYARVLEIPTPRWTAYEAKRYSLKLPDHISMTTQERAYTSPIWYTPKTK